MINGIDALTFLDVVRNEELYTKRLKEINEAEKALADAKFIAATVAQANKYRDEAKIIKEDAVALKLRIEAEVKELKKKTDEEIAKAKAELEVEQVKVKDEAFKAKMTYQAAKDQERKNAAEFERIRKYDMEICAQASQLDGERKDFMNRLAQAKEILNG